MRIYRHITILLLLATATAMTATDIVDKSLEAFQRHKSVENANAFFRALNDEGYTDELIEFTMPVHCDSLQVSVFYWAAEYCCNIDQDYHRSIALAQQAAEHTSEHSNPDMLSDCYALLAADYFYLSDWDKAAQYAKWCYRLDAMGNDFDRISSSLNTLACIYQSAKQYDKAEKYILKGIEYAQQADNKQRQAVLNGTASEIYHSMGNDTLALEYATQAYAIEVSLRHYAKAAVRQSQMGSAMLGLKRHNDAKKILTLSIDTLEAYHNTRSLAITYRKLADAEIALADTAAAIKDYNTAVELCQKIGNLYNEAKAHAGLYHALRHSAPKQAMQHIDRYNDIKDSLYKIDTSIALADFDAQYDNNALKDRIREQDDALNSMRKQTVAAVVVVVVVVVVICLLFALLYTRRNRKKTIEKLREEYERAVNGEPKAENQQPEAGNEMSEADTVFLDSAINFINNHLDGGDVSIDAIAAALNMSAFQFRKRLLLITRQRPMEFVQSVRMSRACHLLSKRLDLPVNEIGLMCGYNDSTNFIRSFKRIFGITPMQYRSRSASV